jgi:hypothetical protein
MFSSANNSVITQANLSEVNSVAKQGINVPKVVVNSDGASIVRANIRICFMYNNGICYTWTGN